MSIFVDPNSTFVIRLKFRYVEDSEGNVTGIETLPTDATGEDVETLACRAAGRDFETMSNILEQATIINAITGKPMIKSRTFCRLILLRFFRAWNVPNEDGSGGYAPINDETIGRLDHTVATALARRWLIKTRGKK